VVGDRQGLSGRQRFAIDGVKLPGTAAKARGGTRKECRSEATQRGRAVRRMLARHRQAALTHTCEPSLRRREVRQVERLKHEAAQSRAWLRAPPTERRGVRGGLRQSHRTDTESAPRAPGQGVLRGYTGVAVVDERPQSIVAAQAHGVGQEQARLLPMGEAVQSIRAGATVLPAEAGYDSEDNLRQCAAPGIDASLPDNGERKRAPRYAGQDKHRSNPAPSPTRRPSPQSHPCCVRRTSPLPQLTPPVSAQRVHGSTVMDTTALCGALGR
jgi:hypothetical protein